MQQKWKNWASAVLLLYESNKSVPVRLSHLWKYHHVLLLRPAGFKRPCLQLQTEHPFIRTARSDRIDVFSSSYSSPDINRVVCFSFTQYCVCAITEFAVVSYYSYCHSSSRLLLGPQLSHASEGTSCSVSSTCGCELLFLSRLCTWFTARRSPRTDWRLTGLCWGGGRCFRSCQLNASIHWNASLSFSFQEVQPHLWADTFQELKEHSGLFT